MIPSWFLYVGGFSLIILGGLQLQARPHEPGDSFLRRFVNLGTVWSLTCIIVGVYLVLMALGYAPSPVMHRPPSALRP